jgi:acetate kinase
VREPHRVLVLNAGSSTLKASVVEPGDGAAPPGDGATPPAGLPPQPLASTTVSWGSDATRAAARVDDLRGVLSRFTAEGVDPASLAAVGHRVVHGGERFTSPVLVDDAVLAELDDVAALAPLHNPVAIETIRAARAALPEVPHVAAFDTAFHASLDETARTYALPASWRREHGLRRYGFHGLSVAWSVRRAADLLERPAASLRLVVAHLGSGCSVTAVDGGRSVATSMGLTPLEGLVMGTRAGSVDPGILLRLLRAGFGVEDLAEGLDHDSGLVGVSGRTSDMRELLAASDAGDADAALAIELFVRSAAAWIGAMATSLPALDAVVFTGGIGEHAAPVRARVVARLGVLGVERRGGGSDGGGGSAPVAGGSASVAGGSASVAGGSASPAGDAVLSARGGRPAILRVIAREDLVIAEAAASLLG